GALLKGADFCFPVKAAHGHLKHFFDLPPEQAVDFVLVPYLISEEPNKESTNSHYCPYVQCQPGYLKAALALNGNAEIDKILSPVVDLRLTEKKVVKDLFEVLGGPLKCSEKAIQQAWQAARKAQLDFARACEEEGKKILAEIEKSGQKAIVFLGRPYNTCDLGSNLALPRKVSELGYMVLPLDFLPVGELPKAYENIYWSYPQRIMKAVEVIRQHPNLFGVFLTNFNCGPDSFVLTFAEHAMGTKPMLTLELDEHGADTGYITRIEAFMDVLKGKIDKPDRVNIVLPPVSSKDMKRRKLYIPPLLYPSNRLFAAAFRSEGYDAECLPQETRESFELGRSLTRGSECLPMALTAGTLHARLREVGADPKKSALFIATENGPCRFGQYSLMHRLILDRLGYGEMPILSPTYYNTYQGIEPLLRPKLFTAMVLADILYKALCKVRPYEIQKGETDRLYLEAIGIIERAIARNGKLKPAVREGLDLIRLVPQKKTQRPLVGVVGEIYVRLNLFGNENLDRAIERFGGEAWFAPSAEWIFYSAHMQKWLAREGITPWWDRGSSVVENLFLSAVEEDWMRFAGDFLNDRHEPPIDEVIKLGRRVLPFNHHGETLLTIGRAKKFSEVPVDLIVNCAPFGCMPGTLTSAIFQKEEWGVPIVNLMYDGNGQVNDRLEVFLNNLRQKGPRLVEV
ncbi:MAG TPA: acyl-CoA dehydratase activase-related protein, partial [Chroococcales cyanobacterium]